MAVSLSVFHPTMAHRRILWNVFEENVIPVVMIFHKPSIRDIMASVAADGSGIDRALEAVIFAVYFAAVTSMDPEQCAETLGEDHSYLQQHYRTTLFLTCLRAPEDAAFVWTMTAAVHRMAQGLGLHRDGTYFGLSPFEVEIRRRLWWSIYLLDSRSSEFRAIGPQITEHSYDTRLPLNIDDSALSPDSIEAPEEKVGFTEMTFCLARCEMIVRHRRFHLNIHSGTSSSQGEQTSHQLGERMHALEQISGQLQDRYLRSCDVSVPIQWVTATVIRLALARSWLIAHLPERVTAEEITLRGTSSVQDPTREQLFQTAVEVLEFAYLLDTDPRTKQWSWFFESYPQWHSVVFVLSELCARPRTILTDRAWAVTVRAVARWTNTDFRKGGITLKIILQLMEQAATAHGRVWAGIGTQTSPLSGVSQESDGQMLYPS
ncbi:conserved hypothetical protein [Talaromyces stipitatus ATCC 10500]|uniref:Xylanolytic transcriptional activator regulatory domain-containing protein n=1 Tax=Talaromyces stipitatus (strain ATCC 10500 / CBS 375.48 / QM 6759 / NRRL 1006) TaxID=441959 RepID=B8MA11_TALSN|nr:uncharacterized protein TSTA_120840 [Talaromyces stipitatus ATCC 10500]EED18340.1 conserved hypothetical protein [Talaromyces stipitatus ATCC 10500]